MTTKKKTTTKTTVGRAASKLAERLELPRDVLKERFLENTKHDGMHHCVTNRKIYSW